MKVGCAAPSALKAPSAVMPPSKPVSTDCKRKPAGPLNTTPTSPSLTVLGDDQFLHAVAVEVDGQRRGLDLVELAARRSRAERVLLLHLHVPASHRRGGAPYLLALVEI